jgi:hypothetical protein
VEATPPAEHGPAEELRRKLDEARAREPAEAEQPDLEESPEERRRRVHEHGRAATDKMRGSTEEETER